MAGKLNGHTGIISQVWRKRALVRIKLIDAEVGFDIDVVFLPDGTCPESLLDYMKAGSTVHYNAEPCSDNGYLITRVWLAGGGKAPAAAATKPATPLDEKALKSQLKAMLYANGRKLPLSKMHVICMSSKNGNSHVYGDKVEGLKSFLAKRPNLFHISNGNVVTVIKEAVKESTPPIVHPTITDKVLRRQLQSLLKTNPAPMKLDQIHRHYSRKRPELAAAYKDSESGLRDFVTARPTIFHVQNDTVTLVEGDERDGGAPSAESDEYGLLRTVAHLKRLVGSRSVVNLDNLLHLLIGCDLEVLAHVGNSVHTLRAFLLSQSDSFYVSPQGFITLCDVNKREVEKVIQEMKVKETPKPAKKAKKGVVVPAAANGEAGRPASAAPVTKVVVAGNPHMDSLNFLRNTLWKNGPLPVTKLVGHLGGNSTDAIRDYVGGGTATGLLKFLQGHRDLFEINSRGVCSIQDGQGEGASQPSLLANVDGVVQHVAFNGTCGFIQNGSSNHDNIYFKPSMVASSDGVGVGSGRLKGLDIGDSVDCLYELCLSKSCKYRAVGVWPTLGAGSAVNDTLFNPISVIETPVVFGQGVVGFLMDGMGYVTVNEEGKAGKMIIFHMKHIDYKPKYTWDILAEGSRVLFVAVWRYNKEERRRLVEVWDAIHIWPMSLQGSGGVGEPVATASSESWDGEAVVQELTCEGGCLSFGRDPYSERVTFTWRDLLARRLVDGSPQRIAVGFTRLCVATASPTLAAVKWVATELYRPDDPTAPKRLQVHRSQRMDEPLKPVRRSSSSGIGALSAFLSGETPPPLIGSSIDQKEEKNLLDFDDEFDYHSLSDENGSSDGTNDDAILLGWETTPNVEAPSKGATCTDEDKQLPKNYNESDFIKEALDACTLYLAVPKGGEDVVTESQHPLMVNGTGVLVATSPFGGVLETSSDKSRLVYFGAHSFFFRQSPVSHTSFQEGTRVHFNAEYAGDDNYQASLVWIGTKPSRH